MIIVSTAGFSYKDWVGPFYAPGTAKWEMLPFFAGYFRAVELNYSFYSIPGKSGISGFLEKAPGMRFALKAHKSFTHQRDYGEKELEAFKQALSKLKEENALIALLLQFPYSFHATEENLDYLEKTAREFEGFPVAVEFRHSRWKSRRVYDFLNERNLALVTTDAPDVGDLFRGGWERIGPFGYVRLHGRNAAKWYEHEHAWQRYDYTYPPEEISALAAAVGKLTTTGEDDFHLEQEEAGGDKSVGKRDVFVFFNNHWQAQGVLNALQLRLVLGQELPDDLPEGIKAKLKP